MKFIDSKNNDVKKLKNIKISNLINCKSKNIKINKKDALVQKLSNKRKRTDNSNEKSTNSIKLNKIKEIKKLK